MSRVTAQSLKSDLASVTSNRDYYKNVVQSHSAQVAEHWKARDQQADTIRTQRDRLTFLEQENRSLRSSINSLHEHHQKELIAADRNLAAALETMAQMSLGALKDLGDISRKAIEETKAKAAHDQDIAIAERNATERMFLHLADRLTAVNQG